MALQNLKSATTAKGSRLDFPRHYGRFPVLLCLSLWLWSLCPSIAFTKGIDPDRINQISIYAKVNRDLPWFTLIFSRKAPCRYRARNDRSSHKRRDEKIRRAERCSGLEGWRKERDSPQPLRLLLRPKKRRRCTVEQWIGISLAVVGKIQR